MSNHRPWAEPQPNGRTRFRYALDSGGWPEPLIEVVFVGGQGQREWTPALVDSGAGPTFITRSMADRLGAPPNLPSQMSIGGIEGSRVCDVWAEGCMAVVAGIPFAVRAVIVSDKLRDQPVLGLHDLGERFRFTIDHRAGYVELDPYPDQPGARALDGQAARDRYWKGRPATSSIAPMSEVVSASQIKCPGGAETPRGRQQEDSPDADSA